MSNQAVKFTDLDSFLRVMEEQGISQQIKAIIYEDGKLPYCTAYFIPTDLLPIQLDANLIGQFAGSLTHVNEISYLGNEQFHTDFMVYPLSLIGYVEVDNVSPVTFADDNLEQDRDDKSMMFVINLEDGGGQEFFVTADGQLVELASTATDAQPQEFRTLKALEKKVLQLREKYSPTCRLYALERSEFDNRRSLLQKPTKATPEPDNT